MADKPRRPILHLKFPSAAPADPDAPAPAPATPVARTMPIAPAGRTTRMVREFIPARPPRLRRAEPPPKPKPFAWKCKPCGTGFDVADELADDKSVRCPSCNARLGLAGDFRCDPPNLDKLRARAVGTGAELKPPPRRF